MSTLTRRMSIQCTACGETADLPSDRDHSALWDAGWRWIGPDLISCPACPPVLVIDTRGRHRRGPGAPVSA
ncbi:hypothetical protein [Streptomyces sp. CC224B]|uniref:hypothetical protein n=1 Tax=Streptomyces sp. CC224B TaxID=3044571 RepID=UPI0024A9B0D7|nr:hypothetical protein [Streptomyces sp. CC224B]